MAELALRISAVSRRFAHFPAVSDVSLEVPAGQRLAMIGPNGAGKTTLLGMVGGQISCDSGRIEYFGQDITRLPDFARARLGIARSFQVPSVFPENKIVDNVSLAVAGGLEPRLGVSLRRPKDVDPAKSALDAWGLEKSKERLPTELSHGERRRLELALAFAVRPKLALLDEPTAGLTLKESPKLVQEIGGLGREMTVILVDHDMSAVFAIAERIVVMHRGAIIADGSPSEVRASTVVNEVYGSLRGSR